MSVPQLFLSKRPVLLSMPERKSLPKQAASMSVAVTGTPAILLGTAFSTEDDGLEPDVIFRQELTRTNPCRWDGCFIRLLDGMLQAGALGSTDYQLRIPTKIRHLEILDAKPALPAGSESESLPSAAVAEILP